MSFHSTWTLVNKMSMKCYLGPFLFFPILLNFLGRLRVPFKMGLAGKGDCVS